MGNRYCIFVDTDKEIRIDKFLHDKFKEQGFSREFIKGLMRDGHVFLNGNILKKPSTKVFKGDSIEIYIPEKEKLEPVKGGLNIIYEDDFLLVIDKPANLTTHPAPSCRETTLVNLLIYNYPKLKDMDEQRPGIVHRLDKGTSGLMVIALNPKAEEILKSRFKNREIKKKYLALIKGSIDPVEGEINVFMDRDDRSRTKMKVYKDRGRESITRYKVLKKFDLYDVSLVEANILTGRTHQIRVHFSYMGHPVLGDKLYSTSWVSKNNIMEKLAKRQMLHSWKLEFKHPITGKDMSFVAKVPKDFYGMLLYMSKKRPMVVGITGSVGSGKSKVSQLLSRGKYPMWSADRVVERLYQKGQSGFEMIKRAFGREFLDEKNGCVDKKKLFHAMKSDIGLRQEVMDIIHPLVLYDMREFIKTHSSKNMVVLEIPLLIEAGWNRGKVGPVFDVVVGVFCSDPIRRHRLKKIRKWDDVQIDGVDRWQLPQREKMIECDIIIDNSFSLNELKRKVDKLDRILRELRKKDLLKEMQELSHIEII